MVIFFTSKLIARFIESFTLKMKSELIVYLRNWNIYIYWILDLEGEVHSIWDLWINGLEECKGNGFSKIGRAGNSFWLDPKKLSFLDMRLPLPEPTSSKKLWGVSLTTHLIHKAPSAPNGHKLGPTSLVYRRIDQDRVHNHLTPLTLLMWLVVIGSARASPRAMGPTFVIHYCHSL